MSVRTLVLGGKTGLLGMSLVRELTEAGYETMVTPRPSGRDFDPERLGAFVDEAAPEIIFNTWAYTQVDLAEDEPSEAERVNAVLPGVLGQIAATRSFRLVHYSTDFVFDGQGRTPYMETDRVNPTSVYGRTKLSGETALSGLCPPERLLIIRTAWLFGPGKKNFVATICGLARQRERLSVVDDQRGSPTYTPDLARHSRELVEASGQGVFHLVNSGEASWFELASEAVRTAGIKCAVEPIPSSGYPQKARRPAYSVLSTKKFEDLAGVRPRPWEQAVREYVRAEIANK